jgi:hypothetical protein
MDPTHYETASGKSVTIKIKPSGIDGGCYSRINCDGKTLWRSCAYPEGCAALAKAEAIEQLQVL